LAFGDDYLIIHTVPDTVAADVRAHILGTGLVQGNVDVVSAQSATPSLAQMQTYDAVFVFSANGFQNAARLGNNLAEYADGGGGVVVAPLTTSLSGSIVIGGRFLTEAYSPFTAGATKQFIARQLGTIYDANHPLVAGVTSFHGGGASLHNQVSMSAGATRVADYDNGVPLVGCKPVGNSFVVGLNFYPPSSSVDSNYWITATDGAKLMANALNFSKGVRNLAPEAMPDQFSMNAGGVLTIAAPGILANDLDPDADSVTIVDEDSDTPGVQPASGPQHGSLQLFADGSFTYEPYSSFAGEDSFTYRVFDGTVTSTPVTVTFTVSDTTAPILSGTPDDIHANATGPGGAVVTFTPPTAADAVDGDVVVQSDWASGSEFPLGTTVVTFSATDSAGNTASSTFQVIVTDQTAPIISGTPNDVILITASSSGALASFDLPTAYDQVDGAVTVTSSHTSGSVFGLGKTTVTFTATDAAGNTATTSFEVWVQYSATPPAITGNDARDHKAGSVIQIRFALTGVSAGIKNANAVLRANGQAVATFSSDNKGGTYTAQWKTKGMAAGEYDMLLVLGDGVLRPWTMRLK
jgi:hypothetical protein